MTDLCSSSKGNLNQPAAYPVPMVTQAPPIQPLPVRAGVIAQVRHIVPLLEYSEPYDEISYNLGGKLYFSSQQAWSSRGQQLLVPAAWQQMTPVGPPPSHPPPPPPASLTSDSMVGPQRIGDWGSVEFYLFTFSQLANLF